MSELDLRMKVPEHILPGLDKYVEDRCQPSGFLIAVLSNNLSESFGRANEFNRVAMFDIVNYIYNCLPSNCWGSPERVQKWLNRKENE